MTIKSHRFTGDSDVPLRTDGTPWPYAMSVGDILWCADTISELVGAMPGLDGYSLIPDTPEGDTVALVRRFESCAATANILSDILLSDAINDGRVDLSDLSEAQVTALTRDRATQPSVVPSSWDVDVPLFDLAPWYAPATGLPAPVGDDVVLIDPSGEREMLDSLGAVRWAIVDAGLDPDELGLPQLFIHASV